MSSPRNLRQLNQLIDLAEERRGEMRKTDTLRKLDALFQAAEDRRQLKRASSTRRYQRHSANVPHVARRRSSSRTRRGRSVDRTIYVPAARVSSDSDDDYIKPSGAALARWDFHNTKMRRISPEPPNSPNSPRSKHAQEEISRLIRNFQSKVRR
jgi:hypothetical protein